MNFFKRNLFKLLNGKLEVLRYVHQWTGGQIWQLCLYSICYSIIFGGSIYFLLSGAHALLLRRGCMLCRSSPLVLVECIAIFNLFDVCMVSAVVVENNIQ
jgi:hypothetical protein